VRADATIYVRELAVMAAFYAEGLGFAVVDDASEEYRVLESETWSLSIVAVPPELAATIVVEYPPARRETTPLKLTFDVPSIEAVRESLADLGGRVEGRLWEFRGFRHCDLVDPEGNVALLREVMAGPPDQ
jgi:predicted enzyme related to lactoylglutathione lyase